MKLLRFTIGELNPLSDFRFDKVAVEGAGVVFRELRIMAFIYAPAYRISWMRQCN